MKLAHKKNLVHFYFRILAKDRKFALRFNREFTKVNNGKRFKHWEPVYLINFICEYYINELGTTENEALELIEEIKKGYL